jgi:hypothetical protein
MQFLLNMWVMHRVTSTQIQNSVTRGYITQEEADMILATPQI